MSLLFSSRAIQLAAAMPTSVTLAGSLQSELGCPGDWQPECATTHLSEVGNGVWRAVFNVPAGDWEYKMALNDSWDESYAGNHQINGNTTLNLAAAADVRFYFDDKTKAVLDSVMDEVATAAGSFQSELGCPGDWQPDCVRSLLTDVEGDGVYTFMTDQIPAGDYEFKVAKDEAWDEAYPADNFPFNVPNDNDLVTITWNSADNNVTVEVGTPPPPGPSSVTLAGSLQSELGCPGDWQPECATTHLAEVGNGVWRAQFTVPAGTWEYKMALNNSWDESYAGNHQINGNTTLNLDAETAVIFYFDYKTKAVLDSVMDEVATAAGSFQSALGCPDNWQPECVRSLLTDVEGDGIYTFMTDQLPAGDYEFKVAKDEAWDEAYPADNLPFSVPTDNAQVTITWNAVDNNVTVEVGDGGGLPTDPTQIAARVNFNVQTDVFYFVLTDRFENATDANNTGGIAGDSGDHGYWPTDISYYHGGDFAGMESRLDYLEGLGITALWITPPFKNQPTQPDGSATNGIGAAYHGYWILDYANADPHLGTNAELLSLIEEAQARGMKVYFDLVVNHTADVIQYEGGDSSYRNKQAFPYRDAEGNTFDDRDYAGSDSFPALDPAVSFPYTPVIPEGMENAKFPAWLNNAIYYHNRGSSTFAGESSNYGDFFGLDDLFTEHPAVVNGYIDIAKQLIDDYGIDGFRLDTVKHVNIEFWQQFGPAVMEYAAANGKPDFYMYGEVFEFEPATMSRYTTEGALPSVVDFGLWGAARNFASQSGATNNLRDFFAKDDYYTDTDSNAYGLGNFVSNHDGGIERLGGHLQNENAGATDGELVNRSELAHALIYFARGFPIVYYGDEQGFVGTGSDKLAREDMFASQVAAFNDNDLIGTDATTADSNFDPTHPLYGTLADMASVRAEYAAFSTGAQIHRYSSDGAGLYAFSRIDRADRVEYLVVLNNSESTQSADVPTGTPEAVFDLLYSTGAMGRRTLRANAAGRVAVEVPPLTAMIWQAEEPMACGAAAPAVTVNVPAELLGRAEIGATLAEDVYAEVTFAVSSDGGATYTIIGTDDNAPYRVFYDVSGYAVDTELVFQAVVDDLCGNEPTAHAAAGTVISEEDLEQKYAIIHYYRPDGDYGDFTSADFNDFWGLHMWGNAVHPDDLPASWQDPVRFSGFDSFGAYVAVRIVDDTQMVNYIIHRGDAKDPSNNDQSFDPAATPEIWIVSGDAQPSGDANEYTSPAAALKEIVVHYQRADGNYDGWGLHLWQDGWSTDWGNPLMWSGEDDYGKVFNVSQEALNTLIGGDVPVDWTQPINFIMHRGDEKDTPNDRQFDITGDTFHFWLLSDDETVYTHPGAPTNTATIHYHRCAGDYGDYTSDNYADFWGLHTWGGADDPGWTTPRKPTGTDSFGVYFEVPLFADATALNYILHRGDEKDVGPDQQLDLLTTGYEIWVVQRDNGTQYTVPAIAHNQIDVVCRVTGSLAEQRAHWLSATTFGWAAQADLTGAEVRLYYAMDGGLTLGDTDVTGGNFIVLNAAGTIGGDIAAKFPHLSGIPAFELPDDAPVSVADLLKGQLALAAFSGGSLLDATGLQIPGVLDDVYYYTGDLGVIWSEADAGRELVPTLRLWAPTAQNVTLHVFADANPATTSTTYPMVWDAAGGTWSYTGSADWNGQYYLYEVEVFVNATGNVEHNIVTDPYSISLAMNSTRSQIIDLNDAALMPEGWDDLSKPVVALPEDISVYELHVRDFSIFDETVPANFRGTFKAFTVADSDGMQHLQRLADAGLTHLHLLPVFDIATINENAAERVEPDYDLLASEPPTSTVQQATINAIRDQDGFNWGYDPFHYTTPEGSYSTDPNGTTRILEFREMVQALNEAGLLVVMDVVYNHTNASGQADKSVLDRIVPGYYHRLNAVGAVENSTCCANTASEHLMMEKLMIDSLVTWATAYKIDSFRFDLMGHHMKSNMLKALEALHSLTPEDDGVDGGAIYLYGEGWNFGEVANNARGVNATQLNMAGTGIGTFSDRLRDAVRGPGPFDGGDDLRKQGFISGQFYDPNGHPDSTSLDRLLLQADQIRVGLAGNLAAYEFIDRTGATVTGAQVPYGGGGAGYTADPQEHIVYVSKHDNQTLYDINAYTLPLDISMADRVRVQNLGLSIVALGQGVHFFHAGSDILRSKSMDRDSYNSGDWFNRLDWTYQTNNFGVGLPIANVNQDNWELMRPRLGNPNLWPATEDIQFNHAIFQEWLMIRQSSPLFSLPTLEEVQARLAFHNTGPDQVPGLIVMSLSDMVEGAERADLDPAHEMSVVLINANDEPQSLTIDALSGMALVLHPVQQASADAVVRTAAFDADTGTFTVPGRTTAVFVLPVAASISLDVTLSLDGSCGNATSAVVAAGTVVTYCYTVTNTGDVTLTTHTLVDSAFGTLLNAVANELVPAESFSYTQDQTISATTNSTATWTAQAGATVEATAEDSVSVTVGDPTDVALFGTTGNPLAPRMPLLLTGLLLAALAGAYLLRRRPAADYAD